MLVLDTHALVWLDEGNPRLGKKALQNNGQGAGIWSTRRGVDQFLGDRHADQEKATGYLDGA